MKAKTNSSKNAKSGKHYPINRQYRPAIETNEASLAMEAGIPYAAIALSTDYDSWKHDEEPVTWEDVLQVFNENVQHVTGLLVHILQNFQ